VGFLASRAGGVEFPSFFTHVFPVAFVIVLAVYYLLWKYAVQFLNELVDVT
jgi:uncharacterized membrane protein